MRFQNKVAIVTGGASGIGKEVATRFVAEGGSVVINGRNAKKTEAADTRSIPRVSMLPSMSATSLYPRPATHL
jgi:NAD(P)-dependent dehydrogenase (short-subunit alcohol dehydrogenase family)